MKRVAWFSLILAVCTPLYAQTFSQPAPDDTNLYYGALCFIGAVHLHSLQAATPQLSATIQLALRKDLQVDEKDFAILLKEADAFGLQLQAGRSNSGRGWVSQSSAGSFSRPSAITDTKPAATPVSNKLTMTSSTVSRLRTELSGDGWTHYRAFVNGPFRNATTSIRLAK